MPYRLWNRSGENLDEIVEELRFGNRGKTIEQVLRWVTTLHGYLPSPSGGGVRHGTHLANTVTLDDADSRLYCNLKRS